MKFDVVVGNPPYQEDSGTSARDNAIYPYFYDLAEKVGSKYCLIPQLAFYLTQVAQIRRGIRKCLIISI